MGFIRPRFEAGQGCQQQAPRCCILQRAFKQAAEQEIAAAEGAQRRIGEIHGRRTQRCRKCGSGQRRIEVASGQHGGDQAGRRVQGLGEGREHHRRRITARPLWADQEGSVGPQRGAVQEVGAGDTAAAGLLQFR
jgi:hypothetical protein